ncbi:MAG TPA: hypothetical protein VEP90_18590 [Methylomirabilota bacterium]|nr:hypothetical protein [Methylomirabilota bacterium]
MLVKIASKSAITMIKKENRRYCAGFVERGICYLGPHATDEEILNVIVHENIHVIITRMFGSRVTLAYDDLIRYLFDLRRHNVTNWYWANSLREGKLMDFPC